MTSYFFRYSTKNVKNARVLQGIIDSTKQAKILNTPFVPLLNACREEKRK